MKIAVTFCNFSIIWVQIGIIWERLVIVIAYISIVWIVWNVSYKLTAKIENGSFAKLDIARARHPIYIWYSIYIINIIRHFRKNEYLYKTLCFLKFFYIVKVWSFIKFEADLWEIGAEKLWIVRLYKNAYKCLALLTNEKMISN